MSTADGDVSESLSDIDDSEVAGYLNSKEAERFKRIIWEVLNKDYDQTVMGALFSKVYAWKTHSAYSPFFVGLPSQFHYLLLLLRLMQGF